MLADDILVLLKQRPMTSDEIAQEVKKPESVVLTVLIKELRGLVQMESGGKWNRIPPE